jgi:uncharacterized protein
MYNQQSEEMMLKPSEVQIARLFKQRIRTITPIRRLVIFGSRARGEAEIESDLDVFIEVPEVSTALRQRVYEAAWEVGFDSNLVISVFLVSSQSLIDSPLAANPILRAVEADGFAI